jgi:hypothetical protein
MVLSMMGLVLGGVLSTMTIFWMADKPFLPVVIFVVIFFSGAVVGVFQWLALRGHIQRDLWWIAATALGWFAFLIGGFVTLSLFGFELSIFVIAFSGALANSLLHSLLLRLHTKRILVWFVLEFIAYLIFAVTGLLVCAISIGTYFEPLEFFFLAVVILSVGAFAYCLFTAPAYLYLINPTRKLSLGLE